MPTLELDFEVFCAECGEGLCNSTKEGKTPRRNMPFIEVGLCPPCIERIKGEAYQQGYDEGFDRGLETEKR